MEYKHTEVNVTQNFTFYSVDSNHEPMTMILKLDREWLQTQNNYPERTDTKTDT